LPQWPMANSATVSCCSPELAIRDAYNGGPSFSVRKDLPACPCDAWRMNEPKLTDCVATEWSIPEARDTRHRPS
jgi:hypothetical protein